MHPVLVHRLRQGESTVHVLEIEQHPAEPDHQGDNAGDRSEAGEVAGNQLNNADLLH